MQVVEVDTDTCDACPSVAHVKAYVYAQMPSGLTVSYCGSHGTKYFTELAQQAVKIIDLRYLIETH